jgi:hypothetical protein
MAFALVVESFGIHAATVGVALMSLIAWIAIEFMARWYWRADTGT